MPRHVVFVGNGVAAVTAARTLRRLDADCALTLVSPESPYFFSRTALMYALMGQLERRDMEPYPRDSWAKLGISRRLATVTGVDPARRTVTLDGQEPLAYDTLVIASGSRPRALALDGQSAVSRGVVNFVSMADLTACEALVPSTREAAVVGGGLIGVELVESLLHHGVRVTWLLKDPWFFPAALGREEGERVTAMLRGHGVTLVTDDTAASLEADAAGRVSALITRAGRRVACQMVGVCVGVEPAVGWLRDTPCGGILGRGVRVDATLKTALDDVWAVGDCAELTHAEGLKVEPNWYTARAQGEHLAHNLAGRPTPWEPGVYYNAAKFFETEFTTVGSLPRGAETVLRMHPRKVLSQRIAAVDGRVVGFNLLGSRWQHSTLIGWINTRRPLDWVLAHLAEAQFDGDLAREDLASLVETRPTMEPLG
ncbi:MAG: FAD-dependent oxidoreductase [Myxococcales bacterium]|nr:FAD-dependent oxidoreductase [Myxococcales bacterium]